MSTPIPPILQQYLQMAWGSRDPQGAAQFLHPNYRRHLSPLLDPIGKEGQVRRVLDFQAAFGEIRFQINDVVVDGDRFAFRSTLEGVHSGTFAGIRPTGRRVAVTLLDIMRIEDGLIVEQWGGPDMHDLMWQLTESGEI
jgi:predicted ester cyclase